MNDIKKRLARTIAQLDAEEMQYIGKLVCLMRFCPEFDEEVKRIVPNDCDFVSPEQLAAVNALMDKLLRLEGWAEILRPELEKMGAAV